MSKKRKTEYKDNMASYDGIGHYGTLYESMLKSSAYKSLSIGAKQFYTMCRVQAKTSRATASLYKHGQAFNRLYNKNDFVFPSTQLEEYGIKRQNAHTYFKELIEKGFITVKENNQKQRIINVYSFSDKWKNTS